MSDIWLLVAVAVSSAAGGFVGASGARFTMFVVRLSLRLGWDGLQRVFGKVLP